MLAVKNRKMTQELSVEVCMVAHFGEGRKDENHTFVPDARSARCCAQKGSVSTSNVCFSSFSQRPFGDREELMMASPGDVSNPSLSLAISPFGQSHEFYFF